MSIGGEDAILLAAFSIVKMQNLELLQPAPHGVEKKWRRESLGLAAGRDCGRASLHGRMANLN